MGVRFDYFRAAGDAAAVALMDEAGDGPALGAPGTTLDAVDLMGVGSGASVGALAALVRGVPSAAPVRTEPLWLGDVDEGPWLEPVGDDVRDTLASITAERAAVLGAGWARTDELAGAEPLPEGELVSLVGQLAALARRAVAAGDHLYRWSCR